MTSQVDTSKIPIKNIYYMLVYSWGYPQEQKLISVSQRDEKDLTNLISRVLISKLKSLIKKGIYKEYSEAHDTSGIIKGKINFKESISDFSFKRGKMYIQYEELTVDNLFNQIVKSIAVYLLQYNSLEMHYKNELKRILNYFNSVSDIKIKEQDFKNLIFHKNNYHYKFIILLCRFIWTKLLLHESESDDSFNDFTRNHQELAKLFEKFVRNFYDTELTGCTVNSRKLHWDASGSIEAFLPKMFTDISIDFPDEKIVLDTKFYHNAFTQSHSKDIIRSAHVYQVFAYLMNNSKFNIKKQTGMLLYPEVDTEITLQGTLHQFDFKVCTVNLYDNWKNIHERLLKVIAL
ncbi:5-methylcytosine restriction system specificity protein McrC [Staphylococcus equorum]|uniref:5-methylcytosine restriction system specificity protein McrC n=1 Tax=Staphylococcus equorum TaxID=246432 RepID=UPI003EBBA80D